MPQGSPPSEEFPFSETEGKFIIPSKSILKGKSDIDTQALNYEALLGFSIPLKEAFLPTRSLPVSDMCISLIIQHWIVTVV